MVVLRSCAGSGVPVGKTRRVARVAGTVTRDRRRRTPQTIRRISTADKRTNVNTRYRRMDELVCRSQSWNETALQVCTNYCGVS